MVLTATILGCIAAAYLAVAVYSMARNGMTFSQALLYVPFKLAFRIDDSGMRAIRRAEAPIIYAVVHQSRLDPALMLCLLPDETLHILDEESARATWLEPWRELARTIAFNTEHVFVSRRLVRVLKRKGTIAVYLPDNVEPDARAFRLYRAVSRIALQAGARIVPVIVDGARYAPGSLSDAAVAPRRWFPPLRLTTLPPLAVPELVALAGPGTINGANAFFDRVADVRLQARLRPRTLFETVRAAGDRFGIDRPILQEVDGAVMSYRRLLMAVRIFAGRLSRMTAPGDAVGVLLANSTAVAVTMLALHSGGKIAAMLNHTAGPAATTAAVRTARLRLVVSSRVFVEKAGIADIVAAAEEGGARFVWVEQIRDSINWFDRGVAALLWRNPVWRQRPDAPALLMFTSGSEALPKAVVLTHRNVIANARQVQARLDVGPRDRVLNVLPVFHGFGLTGGLILPILAGVRTVLYPTPLHFKLIPKVARKTQATILFATDTFLSAYARAAGDEDFAGLRLAVAGAELLRPETRRLWRDRFDVSVLEGYGMTEAAPVVSLNTASHNKEGTAGRLLPGMRARLEPVVGIADAGELIIAGPNVMGGYIDAERPGVIRLEPDLWHRTGDIVSVDREGYIMIRGRLKRFAKIGGEMVSLVGLESVAARLRPEHAHGAVALPHPRRGEAIVLLTTAPDLDRDMFAAASREAGLPELALPQAIMPVDAFPLLATGKVDYAALKRLATDGLDKGAAEAA